MGPMRSPLAALLCLLLVAPPAHARTRPVPDLDAATIPQLVHRMDAGTLTSVDLTRAYLRRIGTVDLEVRSVLVVNPEALSQAAESDRRRAAGRAKGLMDGIPVLLKDNIDTRGPMGGTAGSRALRVPPRDDAALVTRLRAAGAVVLGKANLSEWANFRSTRSTSGWKPANSRPTPTRAPLSAPASSPAA